MENMTYLERLSADLVALGVFIIILLCCALALSGLAALFEWIGRDVSAKHQEKSHE